MSNEDITEKKEKLTPEIVRRKNLRPPPLNPLEINQSLIEPRIGRERIGGELDSSFKTRKIIDNGDGTFSILEADAWEQLTTVTSDVRLSNLSYEKPHAETELRLARFWMKMSQLTIQESMPESALFCQSQLTTVTETSQAKAGFLRNNLQTIRQESQHIQIEDTPKKKSLIGTFFNRSGGQ